MTNRRSFFKMIGLATGALAVKASSTAPAIPANLPPLPVVRSKAAHVTSVAGNDWTVVRHNLRSYFVCAMAGAASGPIVATVELIDADSCRVQVPKPPRGFFSWLRKAPPSLYRLIVYVPA